MFSQASEGLLRKASAYAVRVLYHVHPPPDNRIRCFSPGPSFKKYRSALSNQSKFRRNSIG